jgi:glucose/arabinose dehydrogenase
MSLDVAILGGRKVRLPEGWTKQTLVTLFGGADVDARATPGEGARLTIVAILGGARVLAPDGARVTVGGFAFLGGRRVDVQSRPDGPEIRLVGYSVLGGIEVT